MQETLAVAYPFCTVMLDVGVREIGSELRVADVSTLLAESLDGRDPRAPFVAFYVDLVCREPRHARSRSTPPCSGRSDSRRRSSSRANGASGFTTSGSRAGLRLARAPAGPGGDAVRALRARTAPSRPGRRVAGDVDAVHAAAVDAGAEVLHRPQLWPVYHPAYYAVFLLDPDGFRLEVASARDARL